MGRDQAEGAGTTCPVKRVGRSYMVTVGGVVRHKTLGLWGELVGKQEILSV